MEIRYIGVRLPGTLFTVVKWDPADRPGPKHLPPCNSVRDHSPDGFSWGYGGSGPAQLALALCVDALRDIPRALRTYQQFKWRVIANLPPECWCLTAAEVIDHVRSIEAAGH